ncbi:MAG TPA: adenylate/guanylate cyclase domain-containing protein [Flavobacteriales bacterium]|jgi:class 3 adenylate cyclase|nr:adenylate/guanylate cyclase domain-containing protein [Flavobacteriales bacterium]
MVHDKPEVRAILSADIVGWTLVQDLDFMKATQMAESFAATVDLCIKRSENAILIALIGDGMLASFETVEQAIECARDMQSEFIRSDPKVLVRIGIDIGRVSRSKLGTYFGLPMHIATRLQSDANPGSILITEAAYSMVRNISGVKTNPLSDYHTFKGISHPTGVYCVMGDDLNTAPLPVAQGSEPNGFLHWAVDQWHRGIFLAIAVVALSFLPLAIYRLLMHSDAAPGTAGTGENVDMMLGSFISVHLIIAVTMIFIFNWIRKRYVVPVSGPHNMSNVVDQKDDSRRRMLAGKLKIDPTKFEDDYQRAVEGAREFITYWRWFWIAMLCLFPYIWIKESHHVKGWFGVPLPWELQIDQLLGIVTNFCNDLATFFIVCCTTTLFFRRKDNSSSRLHLNRRVAIFTGCFLVVLVLAEIITVVVGGTTENADRLQYFAHASAFFAAIAIGALVARLDSRLIKLDFGIVLLLLGYVAAQSLYTSLGHDPYLLNVALPIVLVGKIVLSMVIWWLSETKKIIYYFIRMNHIMENSERIWKDLRKEL